ncbi:MAG TPA: hypothetical protein VHV51_13865 [Polyangiaceae bacterium]|jgi:hypothetical protein|nr:hypothetical protein [Polyangiaceae bacterium]
MLNRRHPHSASELPQFPTALSRSAALGLLLAAIGCAAQGTTDIPGNSSDTDTGGSANSTGGSSGAGTSSAGTANPSGGSTTTNGGTGSAGTSTGSAGASSAGTSSGSAGSGSAGTSSGSAGSAGTGNTGPVTVDLPFSENWESGMINTNIWLATADNVADPTNANWSIVTDDTGKAAELNSDGTARLLVGGNSGWTDLKMTLRVQVVSGSPKINIAFRYHALKEYYYLEFANSDFKLRDRTSANDDIVPTGTKPALATGAWYNIEVAIQGNMLTASLNGTMIDSGTFATTPIAAGGIAIGVGSGTGVVMFDDIQVSAP